ncbi:cellulase family glycosylhydrolase [Mycobacterium sp. NPDC003323]
MPSLPLRAFARRVRVAVLVAVMLFASSVETSVAHAAVPARIDTSAGALGIAESNLYFMTPAELATAMQAFEQMGVTQIRVFLPWRAMEPNRGAYNWTIADRILDAAAQRGIAVVGAVTSTPIWASRNGFWLPNAAPNDPADYARFMTQVALRYGSASANPRIAAYEIWNEPNANIGWSPEPNVAGYTALLKAAYTAIKAVEPTALIIGGVLGAGLSFGTWTINPVSYLTQMYANGAQGYFDALSFHPYNFSSSFSAGMPYANTPYRQLMSLRQLMDGAGDADKLIWTTEYGVPTSAVSAATQAAWIVDFADTWSSLDGVGPMFIYSLSDRPNETPWGIYDRNWVAKPAVEAIRTWIADRGGVLEKASG